MMGRQIIDWMVDLICTEKDKTGWTALNYGPGDYWVSFRKVGETKWSDPRQVVIPGDDLCLCGTKDGKSFFELRPKPANASLWINLIQGPCSMQPLDSWLRGKEVRWLKINKPSKPTW